MSEGEGIMFGRNGKISKRQIRRILILEQAAKIGLLLPLLAQIPEGWIFHLVMDSDGGSDLSLSEDHAGF